MATPAISNTFRWLHVARPTSAAVKRFPNTSAQDSDHGSAPHHETKPAAPADTASPACLCPSPGSERLDRKSTRLNSSHSQISYAVFCLKKKKKHQLSSTRK